MTVGIKTWLASGAPNIVPDGAGGVFAEFLRPTAGSSFTRTYTGVTGLTIRVYQVSAGAHTWAIGTDGSGNPQIVFTPVAGSEYLGTTVLVFLG